MANSNRAFGFRPAGMLNGSPYNGRTLRLNTATTGNGGSKLAIGDPVSLNTLGQAAFCTAGAQVFGVVAGLEPNRGDLSKKYWATTDAQREVSVTYGKDVLFEVQCKTATATTDHLGDGGLGVLSRVGKVADHIVVETFSTTGQVSIVELDTGTFATTGAAAQWRVWGAVNRPDNTASDDHAKALVSISEWQLATVGAV